MKKNEFAGIRNGSTLDQFGFVPDNNEDDEVSDCEDNLTDDGFNLDSLITNKKSRKKSEKKVSLLMMYKALLELEKSKTIISRSKKKIKWLK